MNGEALLSVKNLTIHYETDDEIVEAVNNISFEIKKGETLGLVGETGAGKTTTALGIMGLIPKPPGVIKSGEIKFSGENLLEKSDAGMRQIRGNRISMIFQDPMTALNPVLTVGDQIAEVVRLHEKCSKKVAYEKACEMLELVGIPSERVNEYPHQFSGGMKQRVVIAISLACNPMLIIADEPTTALDVTIQAQVLELMDNLKVQTNTSMLLITHDLGVVGEICDKVAIMYAGEIVEYGIIDDVYDNTLHPYTQGLFDSLPDLEVDSERLIPIKGLTPDPTDLPKGCSFHPRCRDASPECEKGQVPFLEHKPGHFVRCMKYAGKGE